MSFEFTIPSSTNMEFGNITNIMRAHNKGVIHNIVSRNSPAYITVIEYEESNSDNYKFSTKKLGAPVALSNKFFLQGLRENHQERVQVLETFSDPLILFFDERTKIYTLRGTFLDAKKQLPGGLKDEVVYSWATAFKKFYDEILRGTKLAENQRIALLTVNDQIYMGYPTNLSIDYDARSPLSAGFSMSWIVVKQYPLPPMQVINSDNSSEQIDGFVKELEGLYKVDTTLSGASQEQLDELKAELQQINDSLAELYTELSTLKEDADPAEEDGVRLINVEESIEKAEAAKRRVEQEKLLIIMQTAL